MRTVDVQDLQSLAVGAAILGTGGGGDPYIGRLMAEQAIRENGPVTLLDPEALDDEALVLPTAMMGAPTVMIEKIPEGLEAVRALRAAEQRLGRRADATSPIECGGLNSMIPFIVAARTGLPVVDGDGMGRAFPELQMETFHVYGLSGTPAALADEHGSTVLLETPDNVRLEWLARGLTIRMGGHAHLVDYPMRGADFKRTAVWRTISMAIAIGEAVLQAPHRGQDPVEAIAEATQGTLYGRAVPLFEGKVVDVERRTEGGFAVGQATIAGLGPDAGATLVIRFQNENLAAVREGEVLAIVPDLIAVLDAETGMAVTTERLRYGQRVRVIGIPTPEIMRSDAALAVWGPQAFGLPWPFVPLERRFPDYYRRYGVPKGKEKYLEV
ncbi:DUF917 domain-containing protein [Hydrogenibacillus schlegelii]|uniref:DUF917 domain-containing protein n=1 Tax=Hydrogenibacillus schlegelii TaxID=1484 RepID=A0A132MG16_HYDSH|nr:DUF917 domain-containing protein [Hydrogenibacillus schlegelii]KWW96715.1 hypothetical protein TR75_12785 [Hydrogenibacillus schlegelii]OAR04844.1 hypothetical protein SA87_12275 [Hydrogenibacillus schlegelii]